MFRWVFVPGSNRYLNYDYSSPQLKNDYGTLDFYDQPQRMENGFWNSNITGQPIVQGEYRVVSCVIMTYDIYS